ncbi:MAG: hypothetical protein A2W98_05945 [Bacteroidetes bacterium GWF2_33_38]|nr:MAG: hypothetical protein A2W98_05945 [Bacteroidetes bacterium GWF2_33_38]OFY68639.1 MAG: hypothetical protein A2265_09230 [Bacteroidetes bacterium RIFOXYA12_FULL_33_9]OFY91951.1 MAG: hypothetical protein A2236_02145 [Bacteroidetes bacterium RIFOXYA2_FULL_33_7]HBX49599.1 hypothetical protein [Bacteroidales bacterium]
MINKKPIATWKVFAVFFVSAFALFYFMFADHSSNVKIIIPRRAIPEVKIEQIFNDTIELEQKAKIKFETIYSMLKDTLTDVEEGEILKIVEDAKTDSSLNLLLIKLGENDLMKNFIYRWEEQAWCYDEPGMFKKFFANLSGSKLKERPKNINFEGHFFEKIVLYKYLTREAGVELLSAFNLRFHSGDYTGTESANASLQSEFVNILLENELSDFSPSTIELAKEIFSKVDGIHSFYKISNVGRRKLGIPEI